MTVSIIESDAITFTTTETITTIEPTSYNDLLDKPSIEGTTLEGELELEDIDVTEVTTTEIDSILSQ